MPLLPRVLSSVAVAILLTPINVAETAHAQAPSGAVPQSATTVQRTYDIPAGALATVLNRFADQAGLALVYPSGLVAGLRSTGLSGQYTVDAALMRLLQDSGLTYRYTGNNTVTIGKTGSSSNGAKVLGPLLVEGVATSSGGENGSSDVTATEGTGSYTTGSMTVGSKTPLSIRETPQSVSVITQQQIQDQNLTDLGSALSQAPGITVIGPTLFSQFYSRGFQVANFQLDGGAPFDTNILSGVTDFDLYGLDMAEYDHIEILRGADGLFAGSGDPGGTINLVRKQPLDHDQLTFEADAGSWNDYRAVVDATGPLAFDGRVRARVVVSYQRQDYFYDVSSSNHYLLYATLEADLTSSTLLTVGGSYTRTHNPGAGYDGVPRYSDGSDIGLPRSTCLCTPWSYWNFSTPEAFIKLDQKIYGDWSAKLNLSTLSQTSQQLIGGAQGPIEPVTGDDAYLSGNDYQYSNRSYMADFTVNGSFELFGHQHQVIVGGSYQYMNDRDTTLSTLFFPEPLINIFSYNPATVPEPPVGPADFDYTLPSLNERQRGMYATLRYQVLDTLHLIGGFRYSDYSDEVVYAEPPYPNEYVSFQTPHVVTPYGGVVYDLTKSWSLYTDYTDIFRSQADDLQGPPPGTPLEPIRGYETEGGIKGALLDGALNTSLAVYRILQKHAAVFDDNYDYQSNLDGSSCCWLPTSDLESEGVDAEITGQILPDWQISASYTYNEQRFLYDGNPQDVDQPIETKSPKHLFKVWSTYRLPGAWRRLSVGAGVNGQSATYASGSVFSGYDDEGNPIPPLLPYHFTQGSWAVVSARLGYEINEHWSASVNLSNMADRLYYQTIGTSAIGNVYGAPTNFMFTIRGHF